VTIVTVMRDGSPRSFASKAESFSVEASASTSSLPATIVPPAVNASRAIASMKRRSAGACSRSLMRSRRMSASAFSSNLGAESLACRIAIMAGTPSGSASALMPWWSCSA